MKEEHKEDVIVVRVLLISLDSVSSLSMGLYLLSKLLISLKSHVKELITYILSVAIG